MSKNGFEQRVAFHQQQIKLAQDIEAGKPRLQTSLPLSRKELNEISITEKRKMFAGSGITEVFEEIRDKKLLNLGMTPTSGCQNDVIKYDRYNSIGIEYDSWFHDGGHTDCYGDERGCSSIIVEKLGRNKFKFIRKTTGFLRETSTLEVIGDAKTMIDNIARTVAENQMNKQLVK